MSDPFKEISITRVPGRLYPFEDEPELLRFRNNEGQRMSSSNIVGVVSLSLLVSACSGTRDTSGSGMAPDSGNPGTGGSATTLGTGGEGPGGSTGTGGAETGGSAATGGNGTGGSTGTIVDDGGDAAPVVPEPAGIVAYMYAADPLSTTAYETGVAYAFHQSGGAVTSERDSVGVYTVRANSLAVPMRNVHVTAYGQASRCNVQTFGSVVTVHCYDASGALANSQFSFLALGPSETTAGFAAYAWADDKTAAQYTPSATYAFSASGGTMTALRTAAGTYTLQLAGLSMATGNVQVTGYSSWNQCNVHAWFNEQVDVRCYDPSGALADSRYEVLVTQAAATAPRIIGYATTEQDVDAGGDLSASGYTFNASGGTTTATRTGLGTYIVSFGGADLSGAHVQVTAVASEGYCNVTLFSGEQASVACYDSTGAAADSRFSIAAIK